MDTTTCMYDQATGDLWIADIGHHVPNRSIHFDSSIEAEEYCEKRGFLITILGAPNTVAPFPSHVSDKMARIGATAILARHI